MSNFYPFNLRNRAPAAFLPGLDEANADLGAFDPNELAPPECQSGRGQKQKEFLGLKDIERSIDLKPGAGCRNVEQQAISSPCAVDSHQIDGALMIEADALGFPIAERHYLAPAIASALPAEPVSDASSWTDPKRIVRCAADS